MAADLGERLLGEVSEVPLDEILHDLRNVYHDNVEDNTLKYRLGVDELDGLLDVFMPFTALRRGNHEQVVPAEGEGQDDDDQLDAGVTEQIQIPTARVTRTEPVLEISSTSSAAGKSQLLYYLTALAILPATLSENHLDGRESAVVFIDADGRFDAERLRTVARTIVHQRLGFQQTTEADQLPTQFEQDIEAMLVASLQHVHVFRPQSSSALLATLQSLDTYVLDVHRHFSSSRPLHAIIIDTASAFFWQDKLHEEVARTEDIGRPHADIELERSQKQSFYLADLYADLVAQLKLLQRRFGCAVVYTTIVWGGRPQGPGSRPNPGPFDLYNPMDGGVPKIPAFRAALPPPWGTFPDLRLIVQRDPVRGFPAGTKPRQAEGNAVSQREVLVKGRFLGWVNGWGREEWPRRVVEGVEWRNNGMFAFRVGRDGVEF